MIEALLIARFNLSDIIKDKGQKPLSNHSHILDLKNQAG
jgi:hypothetical protein